MFSGVGAKDSRRGASDLKVRDSNATGTGSADIGQASSFARSPALAVRDACFRAASVPCRFRAAAATHQVRASRDRSRSVDPRTSCADRAVRVRNVPSARRTWAAQPAAASDQIRPFRPGGRKPRRSLHTGDRDGSKAGPDARASADAIRRNECRAARVPISTWSATAADKVHAIWIGPGCGAPCRYSATSVFCASSVSHPCHSRSTVWPRSGNPKIRRSERRADPERRASVAALFRIPLRCRYRRAAAGAAARS